MEKKDGLTKFLAIAGSVLVWLPLLAPVILSVFAIIRLGKFLFDFLIPAELFPIELLGGSLLIFAAFRAKKRKKLIGWSFATAIILLVGSQAFAAVTGLASGERETTGLLWAVALSLLILFLLALVLTGSGGILLTKDLFNGDIHKAGGRQDTQG